MRINLVRPPVGVAFIAVLFRLKTLSCASLRDMLQKTNSLKVRSRGLAAQLLTNPNSPKMHGAAIKVGFAKRFQAKTLHYRIARG